MKEIFYLLESIFFLVSNYLVVNIFYTLLAQYQQLKYTAMYGYISKRWKRDFSQTLCYSGTVYMSRDCAEGLVAKLNSGEVVL